jgi:hypothetical protein
LSATLRRAMRPDLTFSATDLLECHSRSGSAAIASRLRPDATLSGSVSTTCPSAPARANSSFSLMRSQLFSLSY